MSDINVTANFEEVERLKQVLGELAPLYGRTVARIQRDNQLLAKSLKASADVSNEALDKVVGAQAQKELQAWGAEQRRRLSLMKESEKIAQSQAQEEEKLARALEKQALAMQKAKADTAFALGAQRAKEEAQAIEQLNAAKAQQAAREDFLRSKYDQSYAAMRLYKTELVTLNEALDIGAIDMATYQRQVDALKASFASGSGVFQQFNDHINQGRGFTNQLGVVTQQAGYQIGDFLVQVQSGTNWMVAFGQQATQLVGTLPLLSDSLGMSAGRLIAISTGLGIAIPLITAIGAAWMRTSEANNEAADSIETVDQKLKSLDSTLQDWVLTTQAAAVGLTVDQFISQESLEKANEELALALENLKAIQEAQRISVSMGPGGAGAALYEWVSLYRAEDGLIAAEEAYAAAVERTTNLRNKGYIEAARFVDEEVKSLQEQIRMQQLVIQYGEDSVQVFLEEVRIKQELYAQELRNKGVGEAVIRILNQQVLELERLKRNAALAADQAERIRDALGSLKDTAVTVSVNFQARFSGFTDQAMDWFSQTYNNMVAMAQPGFMGSSPRPEPAPNDIDFGIPDSTGNGGGGGGGGSTSAFESKLEEIYKYLELEQYQIEQEKIAHEERQENLRLALDNRLITLEEYQNLERELTEKHNQTLLEIEMRARNARLTELSGMFGQLASIMQAGGSRTAKIAATFGAIEATINSYVAATDALRKATTIPGKIAAYASVLATGLRGVAAIRQAGGIGGGSGGGGGGGPSTSTINSSVGSPTPQTVFIDSIAPDAIFTGQSLINLFDALYDENDRRGKVFVVGRV